MSGDANGLAVYQAVVGAKNNRWRDTVERFGQPYFLASVSPKFRVATTDKVFCIGSCFARNVETHLRARDFDVPSTRLEGFQHESGGRTNSIVNKFTTASILQEVRWLDGLPTDLEPLMIETREGWLDLQLKPSTLPVSLDRAIERRRYLTEVYFAQMAQCDLVVMTLGINEVWTDVSVGAPLNAAPHMRTVKRFPDRFRMDMASVDDNVSALEEIRSRLKVINPSVRILVTVSPVPLAATFSGQDVAVANMAAKSTLRVAADVFQRAHDDVDYFPSYEMVTLSPRGVAFADDCRHVTDAMVGAVIGRFFEVYVDGVS